MAVKPVVTAPPKRFYVYAVESGQPVDMRQIFASAHAAIAAYGEMAEEALHAGRTHDLKLVRRPARVISTKMTFNQFAREYFKDRGESLERAFDRVAKENGLHATGFFTGLELPNDKTRQLQGTKIDTDHVLHHTYVGTLGNVPRVMNWLEDHLNAFPDCVGTSQTTDLIVAGLYVPEKGEDITELTLKEIAQPDWRTPIGQVLKRAHNLC